MVITHLQTPSSIILSPNKYLAGNYYYCSSPGNAGSSNTLGNGTVRLSGFVVSDTVNISSLFAEFSVAGDAGSVFRIGIWNNTEYGKPGPLLIDAGTISTGTGNAGTVATGGTPGVYEIPTTGLTLLPGLYWVGGAVQSAATTQPTMRTVAFVNFPGGPIGTTIPPINQQVNSWGFTAGGTFSASAPASGVVGAGVRIGFKVT
ncbi:MAG: hypothetical protein WAW80_01685 [Candidatus Saccharimonadales bacterium]